MNDRIIPLLGFALALNAPLSIQAADDIGEGRFLAHSRQLTFEGRRSGEGYFSSDGKALIFQPKGGG